MGRVVADVALNDETVLAEPRVEEIRRRKEEEVQARAVEAEERAEREREKRQREEEERARHEKRAREAAKKADRKKKTVQRQTENIRSLAQTVGSGVDWTIRILLFSLLAGGVLFALPKIPPQSGSDWWKVIVTFFVGIAAIYGLYDAFTQARSWSKRAGEYVEEQIEDFLLASSVTEEA